MAFEMVARVAKKLKIAPQSSSSQQRRSRRVELQTRKGLLPSNIKDDELASIHFQKEFRSRFGSNGPLFFTGSLENAVISAGGRGVDQEKLLAIYLHHDGSINADRFSIQILCTEEVAEVLDTKFITWAWDLTEENNKQRFLLKASGILDRGTIYDIGRLHKDRCPVLLIARCRNKRCSVQRRIEGGAATQEFFRAMTEEVSYAGQERRVAKEVEKQRAVRQSILKEQQREYEESLKADQKKEQKAREDERLKKLNVTRELQQQEKKKFEERKLKKTLPKEPGNSRNVITIRLRKPCGEGFLTRKFSKKDHLQELLNFAMSEGYSQKKYRIISLCPRREISSLNPKRLLNSFGLARQETLTMEEK